jgi:hypothetical protein
MSYKSVQAENFAKNNTEASQWEVCEITGFSHGRPLYQIPYKLVQGWSLDNLKAGYFGDGLANCELCGHPIMNLHYIECENSEICMLVGSDCVNTFKGAKFTEKHEKVYREKRIRKMFKEWFPKAWKEFKEIYGGNSWRGSSMYNDGVRYDSRKQWNYMKELKSIDRYLQGIPDVYSSRSVNPRDLTIRKLLGIMERGLIHGLTLPVEHKELTEKPPKKDASNENN